MAQKIVNAAANASDAYLHMMAVWLKTPSLRSGGTRTARPIIYLELILTALIAIALTRLFWIVLAPFAAPTLEPAVISQALTTPSEPDVINPFAKQGDIVSLPDTQTRAATLEETSLDLTLYGTWIDTVEGTAFIGHGDGEQKRYQIGDEIASGVILQETHENWVTISRGGIFETLSIKNRKTVNTAQPASENKNISTGSNLSNIIRFTTDTDEAGGVRIILNPGLDSDAFDNFGFKPGDILISINGAKVEDADAQTVFLDMLAKKQSVLLAVNRNGAPILLEVGLPPESASGGAK